MKNKEEKLHNAWKQTMQDIKINKNDTILDIFYNNLISYFKYVEIAALLDVAIQSVYNYNQMKEKSTKYNNNVRKKLALLFIELLERYEFKDEK